MEPRFFVHSVLITRRLRCLSVRSLITLLVSFLLADISLTQDKEVGDGTTSVAVFASELLKEAEKLIAMRVHPQVIASGYRRALKIAQDALYTASVPSEYVCRLSDVTIEILTNWF